MIIEDNESASNSAHSSSSYVTGFQHMRFFCDIFASCIAHTFVTLIHSKQVMSLKLCVLAKYVPLIK